MKRLPGELGRTFGPNETSSTRPLRRPASSSPRRRALRRFGKGLFLVFLAMQFFSLSRRFFLVNVNEDLMPYATAVGIGSLVLLPIVVFCYGAYAGNLGGFLSRPARIWLWMIALSVLSLVTYGWYFQHYAINAVVHDVGPYLILACLAVLGSIPEFWEDALPGMFVATVVGAVVCAFGLQDLGGMLDVFGFRTRVVRDLLSYETRGVLEFWPLLLLTAALWRPRYRLVTFAVAFFAFGQQVVFQKRLQVVVALAYIAVFLFLLPRLSRHWSAQSRLQGVKHLRSGFVVLLALVGLLAWNFAPEIVTGQGMALLERFRESDRSRVSEALGMIRYLEGNEVLYGRGMGGYFEHSDEYADWGTYLDDAGVVGKRTTHIGFVMPMLKGGVVFMVIYHFGMLLFWKARRLCASDLVSFTAITYVFVEYCSTVQGGSLLLSSSYKVVAYGLCIGRVLTLNRNVPARQLP